MLGTNLSIKKADGDWASESQRLLLMDRKDFNILGIGIDDLIDAYIQTVLSVIAIDRMCGRLMKQVEGSDGIQESVMTEFNYELFEALNPDKALLEEIIH